MKLAEDLVLPKLRCAAVHGSFGVDPIGTAPHWDAVLAVGIPLPWGRDIALSPPFSSLLDSPRPTIRNHLGTQWRPQGLVPDGEAVTVLAWQRCAAGGSPMSCREWRVDPEAPPEVLVELCGAILDEAPDRLAEHDRWRVHVPPERVDLLVCTHGTRDVCCGGSGPAVFDSASTAVEGNADIRIWRTSHTGGHRFAPTALLLPYGYAWAHLDGTAAVNLVTRRAPDGLAQHCRGALTFHNPVLQVADREALVRIGWDWAGSPREAEVIAHERDTLATTVDIRTAEPGGDGFRVRVELVDHIAMPSCGEVDEPEFKTEPVWAATEVSGISPDPEPAQ